MALSKWEATRLRAEFRTVADLDARLKKLREGGAKVHYQKVNYTPLSVTYLGLEIIDHEDKINEFNEWVRGGMRTDA